MTPSSRITFSEPWTDLFHAPLGPNSQTRFYAATTTQTDVPTDKMGGYGLWKMQFIGGGSGIIAVGGGVSLPTSLPKVPPVVDGIGGALYIPQAATGNSSQTTRMVWIPKQRILSFVILTGGNDLLICEFIPSGTWKALLREHGYWDTSER